MLIQQKSNTDLSMFAIVFKGSCNLEGPGSYGVSHLLEHLMCRNFDDLVPLFEEECIRWNAYTSFQEIVFYMSGLEENISKYRESWSTRLLDGFMITPQEFESEKKIVLQEYNDCFSESNQGNCLNLFRQWYGVFDPIGLREDLESLTYDSLLELQKKIYSQPSILVDISPDPSKNDFTQLLTRFSAGDIELKTFKKDFNNSVKLEKIPEGNQSSIYIFNDVTENLGVIDFISDALAGDLKAPFYAELREKLNLCYFVGLDVHEIGNTGVVFINSQTSPDNVDIFVEATLKMLSNPRELLTEDRYNKVFNKLIIKLKQDVFSLQSTLHNLIVPEDQRLSTTLANLTYEKVIEVLENQLKPENWTIVINDKWKENPYAKSEKQ